MRQRQRCVLRWRGIVCANETARSPCARQDTLQQTKACCCGHTSRQSSPVLWWWCGEPPPRRPRPPSAARLPLGCVAARSPPVVPPLGGLGQQHVEAKEQRARRRHNAQHQQRVKERLRMAPHSRLGAQPHSCVEVALQRSSLRLRAPTQRTLLGDGHVMSCASSMAPCTMLVCVCARCCSRLSSESFCTSLRDTTSSSCAGAWAGAGAPQGLLRRLARCGAP